MISVTNNSIPEEILKSKASIFLFGNEQCNVCSALKLKLQTVIIEKLPEVNLCYIDTAKNQILAANYSVFTAPVIIFLSYEKEYNRWVRSFSIQEIINYCNRIIDIQKA